MNEIYKILENVIEKNENSDIFLKLFNKTKDLILNKITNFKDYVTIYFLFFKLIFFFLKQ